MGLLGLALATFGLLIIGALEPDVAASGIH
jgi:hypothetical protein